MRTLSLLSVLPLYQGYNPKKVLGPQISRLLNLSSAIFFVTLIGTSEPMDIDLVDAEQVKSAKTIKKPIKQEAVKKEVMNEKTLSNLLSTQSLVCL